MFVHLNIMYDALTRPFCPFWTATYKYAIGSRSINLRNFENYKFKTASFAIFGALIILLDLCHNLIDGLPLWF